MSRDPRNVRCTMLANMPGTSAQLNSSNTNPCANLGKPGEQWYCDTTRLGCGMFNFNFVDNVTGCCAKKGGIFDNLKPSNLFRRPHWWGGGQRNLSRRRLVQRKTKRRSGQRKTKRRLVQQKTKRRLVQRKTKRRV